MSRDILFLRDLIVGPTVLLIFSVAVFLLSQKYNRSSLRKYYQWAFFLRVAGAVLTALMYQYYYGGGDTTMYYKSITQIHRAFFQSPGLGLEMIFRSFNHYSTEALEYITQTSVNERNFSMFKSSEGIVVRIGGLISLITFNSYLAISLFMTFFAFLGCWQLFRVFNDIFPAFHFEIAMATLFVPSVFFWGTGVMKDPLVMGGLGFLSRSAYLILIKGRRIVSSLLLFTCSFLLIRSLKFYVIAAFLPALFLWLIFLHKEKIQHPKIRFWAGPILLAIGLTLGGLLLMKVSSLSQDYSLGSVLQTAVEMQDYIKRVNLRKGGTGYDLGELQPTMSSALSFFPKGVEVTLFRPYLWEVRKPINLPAALEALFTLILTIYVVVRVGPLRSLRATLSNPSILFCLIFAILFAFAVGVSTYNFGSLSRYKIPCMPFYFLGLLLILRIYEKRPKKALALDITE